MCYHCRYTAESPKDVLIHTVDKHFTPQTQFSMRKKQYDETHGQFCYKSLHFNFSLAYIKQSLENSDKIEIDISSLRISFKRILPTEQSSDNFRKSTQTDESGEIHELVSRVVRGAFDKDPA